MRVIDSKDPLCRVAIELDGAELANLFKLMGSVAGPPGNSLSITARDFFVNLTPVVRNYNPVLPEPSPIAGVVITQMDWKIRNIW